MSFRWRISAQPYSDGAGADTFALPVYSPANAAIWQQIAEEDLILSNVRSFDIKALDQFSTYYVDLGYFNLYNGTPLNMLPTLGHEGRIPPLLADNRADARWPDLNINVGDDQTGVKRLRRVWDSWSTDYSFVPSMTLTSQYNPPNNGNRPAMPSYPPPYPAQLRGIQIQIRVVDPANEHVKQLTIRQDLTKDL